jgi:Flp pilus assembly protein TadB
VRKRAAPQPEQVFSVTGLPTSIQDDQGERMRRYLVSMGIRTACFILAVIALAWLHWTVIGWTLLIAAVILPYIAVVMANATRSRLSSTLGAVPTIDPATPQLSPEDTDEDPPT